MAASEVFPYAKTGGLADMVSSLSQALAKQGHSVTVFLPLYEQVDPRRTLLKPLDINFLVPLSHQQIKGGLFSHESEGVKYYFVECDSYFKRSGLYGTKEGDYPDNAARFVFFSRAVLEAAKTLSLKPDIFHCHDWHTGLIPVYLKTLYEKDFPKSGSLFTIHNLGYQGIFWHYDWHLTNLPWDYFNDRALEFYGKINFLKGGITFSDALSTVSPKYAKEIQTVALGYQLEGVLAHRKKDLVGILNGIDTEEWNPSSDRHLSCRYDSKNLSGKEKCKEALQKEVGLSTQKKRPLLAMITRITEQKGVDLVIEAFTKMMGYGIQFVMMGTGERRYEIMLQSLAAQCPGQAVVKIAYDPSLAHRIEAGADIFLMPSKYEPCGLSQMMSLRYGTVPIVRATGGLDNTVATFNPKTLLGNGFKFTEYSPTALLRQIKKACDLFREKKKWQALIQNGMQGDLSWKISAGKYVKLYLDILEKRSRI